jgi:hypothetical protein
MTAISISDERLLAEALNKKHITKIYMTYKAIFNPTLVLQLLVENDVLEHFNVKFRCESSDEAFTELKEFIQEYFPNGYKVSPLKNATKLI